MPELPYVPFYCSDWLGDTKVRRMSYEERGIHFDLLCHAWQEPIPADATERAQLLGISRRKLDAAWRKIGACWISDDNGALLNPRMEAERAKQAAKQTSGSEGGKAKAKAQANA